MNLLDQFEDDSKTVSEYTRAIKGILERSIPPCWVKGEVSNLRQQSSGHLYFTLKDAGSQLPAVMFRGNASRIGFAIDNGVEVSALGEIGVYEPHGRYQFIVRAMEENGFGQLHRRFELLKKKLQAEGLFETDRKRDLPLVALRVAFVTSPSGAAIQDFIRILKRREWGGSLSVLPARVQGRNAAEEICAGIEFAERAGLFDLIVVGRGGGSLEDLWCFNDESVARKIAGCSLPIVSAVGHEIDFTLSDFAADLRAETPSAAAEIISSGYLHFSERVEKASIDLGAALQTTLRQKMLVLERQFTRLKNSAPFALLERCFLCFDDVSNRLGASLHVAMAGKRRDMVERASQLALRTPSSRLGVLEAKLRTVEMSLDSAVERGIQSRLSRYQTVADKLDVLSPISTMKRGYAVLTDEEGALLSSVDRLKKEKRIKASLSDGSAWLRPS